MGNQRAALGNRSASSAASSWSNRETSSAEGWRPRLRSRGLPALTRSDDVRRAFGQTGVLGARLAIVDLDARSAVEVPCLCQQRRGGVDPDHSTAAARETAGESSRAGSEIDHSLPRATNAVGGETIEQRVGKSRAMAAIVFGGFGEIDVRSHDARLAKRSAEIFRTVARTVRTAFVRPDRAL